MCNIVAVIDLRFWTVLVVAYLATRRFVITPTGRDVIFFVLLVVLIWFHFLYLLPFLEHRNFSLSEKRL